jgi:hypothetical protein
MSNLFNKAIQGIKRNGKKNRGKMVGLFRGSVNTADLRLNPFPPVLVRKFKYCDVYTDTISASGVATTQSFRLNAMHDIDLTGTGHQPRGYDQLVSTSGPYTKYRVMRATGRLRGILRASNTASIDSALIVGYPSIPSTPVTAATGGVGSIYNNLELPGSFFVLCQQGAMPIWADFDFDIWRVFGKDHSQYLDDEGYAGDAGAVPALTCYLITQTQSVAGTDAADGGIAVMMVELEYEVRLEQPIPLSAS